MMRRISLSVVLVCVALVGWGQVDYQAQYKNGKDLFREGKYNLAMEAFKPLIPYDDENPYSAYASFYYALSAYRQNYPAVAKDMLLQIKKVHPKWDKMDEVNLWLANIYLESDDYFQGVKVLNEVNDKKMEETVNGVKRKHLSGIADSETLRMLHEEFPKDIVIAQVLARALATNLSDPEDKKALEQLIDRFKFEKSDFIPEAPATFHKDRYAVAVLLPFMLNELDPSPGKKRNQIVLDFYEGIRLALDSLNQRGPAIDVRAYDTHQGLNALRKLLQTEELKNADLVIGPLYANENQIVQEFSMNNQVNTVNPFSNNTELIGNNPYAFLFQPSSETLGKKAAEFVAEKSRKNLCIVLSGTSKRDSVLAASFVQKAEEVGLTIVANKAVEREGAAEIMSILATATEHDEFKFPSQFTLKKDSIGSIFVATDDPLIYTKVISAVETRGDSILVVGSENWIDDTAVAFEKFQTLGVSFMAPNYVAVNNPRRLRFNRQYLQKYGKVPTNVALRGYEMMLFFGNQLKTNGVYFQDGLNNTEFVPGHLFQGFRYQFSRDNQVVPFVKFKGGILTHIESR
jgi:ABC-type branched-subunit amino acid transport system substrate-binding protein